MTPTIPPAAAAPPVAASAPDPAKLQAEVDALKTANADLQRTSQFWADKARQAPAAPPAAAAPPAEDPEVDLLDIITTQGLKGLKEVLVKSGLTTKEATESMVNSRHSAVTTEIELYDEYPDLRDRKSEFFQATAQVYGDLKKQGVPEAAAMRLAAHQAELDGIKAGKLQTPEQKKAAKAADKEADRQARIKAQSGGGGGRPAEGAEDDDELTPEQRHIAIRMLAGDGVTEEQAVEKYKARAKAGVRMSGKGGK